MMMDDTDDMDDKSAHKWKCPTRLANFSFQDVSDIDVTFRKLLRSVVGPPAATDRSQPWHEILHDYNLLNSIR